MSALTGDGLHGEPVDASAEKRTRMRKAGERIAGKRFPPGKAEIDAYLCEGRTPPTE